MVRFLRFFFLFSFLYLFMQIFSFYFFSQTWTITLRGRGVQSRYLEGHCLLTMPTSGLAPCIHTHLPTDFGYASLHWRQHQPAGQMWGSVAQGNFCKGLQAVVWHLSIMLWFRSVLELSLCQSDTSFRIILIHICPYFSVLKCQVSVLPSHSPNNFLHGFCHVSLFIKCLGFCHQAKSCAFGSCTSSFWLLQHEGGQGENLHGNIHSSISQSPKRHQQLTLMTFTNCFEKHAEALDSSNCCL